MNFYDHITKDMFSAKVVFYLISLIIILTLIYCWFFYPRTATIFTFMFFPVIVAVIIALCGKIYCAINTIIFNFISVSRYLIYFVINTDIEDTSYLLSQNENISKDIVMTNIVGFFIYIVLSRIIKFFLLYSVQRQKTYYVNKLDEIAKEWDIYTKY
ncbi:hypothetical protein [Lyticum sinuosum]|uniref:Uncharacterized protein n=1 Tax=Lyticum sinuosum TaxID=1332059 RepID=A0AAE5AHB6_9RICK|nr:hypothetical protein [Lyticum sinuosum]MDZ5760923.1 hypothetical protein [Lyticum sinuosum]